MAFNQWKRATRRGECAFASPAALCSIEGLDRDPRAACVNGGSG
jgi:hypothetical protein